MKENCYSPLSADDVGRIAESAFLILEKSGINVFSESALKYFRAAGAVVEGGNTVRLPRALVEDAIASNPSSITLFSRDGKNDLVLRKTGCISQPAAPPST